MSEEFKAYGQYWDLLSEEDVKSYDTPNGTTFVKQDRYIWYNFDNPSEKLTTKQLAIRCVEEESN